MPDEPLTGAELARWCYENPNQAASTIEGLRMSGMIKEERDLLQIVALIVLANHTSSGPDANRQREALRKALSPFKTEIDAGRLSVSSKEL
jgi:hypothetical protein